MRASSKVTRQRIHSLVKADPGVHLRRLSFLIDLSWNTTQHHVRRMEEDGILASRKVDGKVCYFDASKGLLRGKQAVAVLRDQDTVAVAVQIQHTPGIHQRALAERMGLACSVIHRRVVKLDAVDLIESVRDGRCTFLYPSEDLDRRLIQAGVTSHALDPAPPSNEFGVPEWILSSVPSLEVAA